MRKCFKVIRFDASDDNVFPKGAVAGEWAVSGAFEFASLEADEIQGKIKQAFNNGMLGLTSWGRSTFVTVSEMPDDEYQTAIGLLIKYLREVFGAPSAEAAEPHACEELDYIVDMCSGKPVNTLFAVRRFVDDDSTMREEFHEIKTPPGEVDHTRIWEVVPDND